MHFFIFLLLALNACGGSEKETEYVPYPGPPVPGPTEPGPGVPDTNNFAAISKIMTESCGGGSCHGGSEWLRSESSLRGKPQITKRISNGSMPPDYSANYYLWEDGRRKKAVLDFLNN